MQKSRPAQGHINSYPTSDAGPYTGNQWAERIALEVVGDPNTANERAQLRGVMPTVWNKLAVTEPVAGTIRVASGAACVNGHIFVSDPTCAPAAPVDFQPSASAGGARPDRVVICVNNTNTTYAPAGMEFPTDLTDYNLTASIEPYSTRLAIWIGTPGGAVTALVQDANHWMIEIARYNISNLGVISSLTDYRDFANMQFVVGVVDANDDVIENALILGTEVDDTGTADTGLGVGIKFKLDDAGGTFQDSGRITNRWHTATAGAEVSQIEFRTEYIASEVLSGVITAPLNASADGNARGVGSVDLQGHRTAVTQVASGATSGVLSGRQNTASASGSVVCGGQGNLASGDGSFVGGGVTVQATGAEAVACGGNVVDASGDYSAVGGGFTQTASGDYASVPGGYGTLASLYGQCAQANGVFAVAGDAQGTIQLVARCTTAGGGAATTLYLDGAGATQRIVIPASSAWTYDVLIVGMRQNAAAVHSSHARGVIYRDNANNTTLASATGVVVEQAGGCTTTVTADDANEALLIQFTDDSAAVWRAIATVRLAQVSYP